MDWAGIGGLFTGVGGLIAGSVAWSRARGERRRDIAAVVNQQAEVVFKGYQKIFDEREEEIRRLLVRVQELTQQRDASQDRVHELGQEVTNLKHGRREDRATIARLQGEVNDLRQSNSRLQGEVNELRRTNGNGR